MDKEESKDENSNGTERQKEVSFRILGIKRKHYEKKDLVNIEMKVDDDKYKMSFLLDNYHVIFFPEFKEIDKYGGVGGFRILSNFLQSISNKTKYYSDIHMKKGKKGEYETYEREWWMAKKEKGETSESDNDFNRWVKNNADYLTQYDLSKFDNDMIDEVVQYIKVRDGFVKPEFVKTSIKEEEDIVSLREMLENAISVEDYEKAVRIREKIKLIN